MRSSNVDRAVGHIFFAESSDFARELEFIAGLAPTFKFMVPGAHSSPATTDSLPNGWT